MVLARMSAALLATAVCASVSFSTTARAEDPPADPGAAQFMKSCGVCHTVDPKAELRQGPNLATVVGRTAGTLAEYPTYSKAMKEAGAGGLVWNPETIDKWISGPADMIPNTNMFYQQPDPDKRKIIIDYLTRVSKSGGK